MTIEEFIKRYEKEPWIRGKHDCILFIHKFLDSVHSKPFDQPDTYPYKGFKGAVKQLKRLYRAHQVKTFEELLDKHYYRVKLPVDKGIVAKADTEALTGFTYGVAYNGAGIFVSESGLKALELNPTTDLYWSVT